MARQDKYGHLFRLMMVYSFNIHSTHIAITRNSISSHCKYANHTVSREKQLNYCNFQTDYSVLKPSDPPKKYRVNKLNCRNVAMQGDSALQKLFFK